MYKYTYSGNVEFTYVSDIRNLCMTNNGFEKLTVKVLIVPAISLNIDVANFSFKIKTTTAALTL